MPYKRIVTSIIFLLLACAILAAFWVVRRPIIPAIDLTNRIHTSFYKDAKEAWNANLQSVPNEEDASKIRLTWDKPTKTYNNFLVTVTNPSTGWTRTESGEHDRVSLDVPDLEPDTEYTFVVRACLDPDCTKWFVADKETQSRTGKMEKETL